MTAKKALDRDILKSEIAALAGTGRAIRVQPYTFTRWAQTARLPEIAAYASAGRVVTIQPYTFERWAAAL
jgi:hypothetical protein